MRLVVGLKPTMPQNAAGARVDPPVSEPIVAAAIRSLIDTALPDDDPPATRPISGFLGSRSYRLRGVPKFAGIPLSIKDLCDEAGCVTKAGSTVLRTATPAIQDASVVARLKAAGFIVIGRTNMTEFAFSGLGTNVHYGTPRSPY